MIHEHHRGAGQPIASSPGLLRGRGRKAWYPLHTHALLLFRFCTWLHTDTAQHAYPSTLMHRAQCTQKWQAQIVRIRGSLSITVHRSTKVSEQRGHAFSVIASTKVRSFRHMDCFTCQHVVYGHFTVNHTENVAHVHALGQLASQPSSLAPGRRARLYQLCLFSIEGKVPGYSPYHGSISAQIFCLNLDTQSQKSMNFTVYGLTRGNPRDFPHLNFSNSST